MDVHPRLIEIFHILEHAAPLLAKLHDVADIVIGREDVRVGDGLLRRPYRAGVGEVGRVVDLHDGAVGLGDAVDNAGGGGDEVEIIFAL